MQIMKYKKPVVLGILFFLPVIFLLFLYPSKHNYNALDIVRENVLDLSNFTSNDDELVMLKDNITVLGFLGEKPMSKATTALNLKELVYDKFMGFKRFQVVIVLPHEAKDELLALEKELYKYEKLKYWKFVFGSKDEISKLYNSLKFSTVLDANLATDDIFIIDKELNQRGRIDDRTEPQVAKNFPIYGMSTYNCIEVAELKNKMSEDMRILFTEYRQKRKGDFNSTTRRADDLKGNEEN